MPVISMPGIRPVNFGTLDVSVTRAENGATYIRPVAPIGDVPVSTIAVLDHWAEHMPDRLFLADRMPNGEWRRVTYREARDLSRAIAQYLIDHKLSADRPVVILSGNSVNHGLVALGCMTAGIPYAPIAPAYSTKSKDFDKLHHVFDLITPGMVFAEHIELYKDAIRAVVQESVPVLGTGDLSTVPGARNLNEILSQPATDAVDITISSLGPETIAKFLFTSGSTGKPKAVINTQGMISANQVMIRDTLAFLKDEPPVLVDWLPWNHTAGGNHNFGIALFNGARSTSTTAHRRRSASTRRCITCSTSPPRSISTCRRAMKCWWSTCAPTRRCASASSPVSRFCNMPGQVLPTMSSRRWKTSPWKPSARRS